MFCFDILDFCANTKTLFIYSSFVCSFVHLFIYSFIHLFIYSFIHLFIYSFIHLFIYSFIHLFIYSFIHLFIYSFTHLFIYSFIFDDVLDRSMISAMESTDEIRRLSNIAEARDGLKLPESTLPGPGGDAAHARVVRYSCCYCGDWGRPLCPKPWRRGQTLDLTDQGGIMFYLV